MVKTLDIAKIENFPSIFSPILNVLEVGVGGTEGSGLPTTGRQIANLEKSNMTILDKSECSYLFGFNMTVLCWWSSYKGRGVQLPNGLCLLCNFCNSR